MTGRGFRRVILIVLDSLGIGEMPDAAAYGDAGSDTLGNIARRRPLRIPNLAALGLANIRPLAHLEPAIEPLGAFGRCALASPGKDTTSGHWEMAGIHLARPFPLYPSGFPTGIMDEFERRTGRGWLGNLPASGTEIIEKLGVEHMRTGRPIVYTSADSVFQVAAHEEVIPIEELYRICEAARAILHGPHEVGRVIARPFIGEPGAFVRTANRKDFAVPPPSGMLLDRLAELGVAVHCVGKISEVFLGRGILRKAKTKNNAEGMSEILAALDKVPAGLIFANLVDFDMLWGHRRDSRGYARGLESLDQRVPEIQGAMRQDDCLIITADHGCDPAAHGSDHTREYVPILVYSRSLDGGVNLGTRQTMADIGQTIAENFNLKIPFGTSFFRQLIHRE